MKTRGLLIGVILTAKRNSVVDLRLARKCLVVVNSSQELSVIQENAHVHQLHGFCGVGLALKDIVDGPYSIEVKAIFVFFVQ